MLPYTLMASARGELLSAGLGGWVRWAHSDGRIAFVRLADLDGRLRPVELYLKADDGLNAQSLRRIPLGRIEAWVNGDATLATYVRGLLGAVSPDIAMAVSNYATTYGRTRLGQLVEPTLTLQADAFEPPVLDYNAPDLLELARLDVPGGITNAPKGTQFYQQVAYAYRQVLPMTSAPAKAIADANGIPITTVHRWIRQCRAEGHLGRATRGKAG